MEPRNKESLSYEEYLAVVAEHGEEAAALFFDETGFAKNGFAKLPSGLTISYGLINGHSTFVPFPVAYSENPYSVALKNIGATDGDRVVTSIDPTGFEVSQSNDNTPCTYIAIGL